MKDGEERPSPCDMAPRRGRLGGEEQAARGVAPTVGVALWNAPPSDGVRIAAR